MIELAPNHKTGLPIDCPIIIGGGVIGSGEAMPQSLIQFGLGAIVVGPITYSSRRGSDLPRLGEGIGSFVLDTGMQNRGVRNTIKRYRRIWQRFACPVIGQVADREADRLRDVARRLEDTQAFAGFELLVHAAENESDVCELVEALATETELPLWVKLPYASAPQLADAVVQAGADALVLCQPPMGRLRTTSFTTEESVEPSSGRTSCGQFVIGPLVGPMVFPLVMHTLTQVAAQELGAPLIVCGGIHRWDDAADALAAGASAVQLDGVLWVEPGLAKQLVDAWHARKLSELTD